LRIPIVASGGIGDGRTMAAAFALGGEGINLGPRFCAVKESPIHDNVKQALVKATERDTNLIFRTLRNTARVLKSKISDEIIATETRLGGCEFKDVPHLVSGQNGRAALKTGDVDAGLIWVDK
jgi:NADH:quinone reductase (non-electrogenic)